MKIVVKSPGEPVPPITIEAMKNFTATSYSRNKKITFILNEMDYMEETALGMDTYKSIGEKFNLPLPIIDFDGSNVVVTFPRSLDVVKEISSHPALAELTDEELAGFEFLKQKGSLKRKQYGDHFGFETKKAERHLRKFVESGLIERKGSGPATYYEIVAT